MRRFVVAAWLAAHACVPATAAGFPDVAGWKPVGETASYGRENRWQYIDGAAELFLAYGFRRLEVRDIESGEAGATVQIYDMGTPLSAFGVFTDKHPPAILTPKEWGVVTPFRWVEIEGWPGELRPDHLRRQAAFASTWDDDASAFASSDALLDRIWELCRYSIKATTFAGVYVDGDRERIPYEADAYLNQLSHYAVEGDVQMARDTFDRLMVQPTWPTEWAFHMIFMAHADWMHTGDAQWLAQRYDALKPKRCSDAPGQTGCSQAR